jgi:hypothetical protein
MSDINRKLGIVDKIIAIHTALDVARIPHAFGGAIALAHYTPNPRGTNDIDVNVFVSSQRPKRAFAALARGVRWAESDVALVRRDGQVRVWWDVTPVDLFFNYAPIHDYAARNVQQMPFPGGSDLPVLPAHALAVFKAFFNRDKDWVDLAVMSRSGTLDKAELERAVRELLGEDDRLAKIGSLPEVPENAPIINLRRSPRH